MLGIAKASGCLFQPSMALDIDVERPIRQYVSDFVFIEERFKRPKPNHVVAEIGGERGFLEFVELNPILGRDLAHQLRDFPPQCGARDTTGNGRVVSTTRIRLKCPSRSLATLRNAARNLP